jgi:hypothetical protein
MVVVTTLSVGQVIFYSPDDFSIFTVRRGTSTLATVPDQIF